MTYQNGEDDLKITIRNKRGLHARASAKFVTLMGEFDAKVTVSKDGTSVCGTSIMGLMMLAAAIGDQITIKGEGAQKNEALDAIEALIENKFDEEC
jgi:phosphocarrier protein